MNRNIPLQVLRAIAAAIVVYAHAITTYHEKIAEVINISQFEVGGIGVQIFFCISGYIVFNSTKNSSPRLQSSINFIIKRLIRVFPIFAIATLIYAVKLSMQGQAPGLKYICMSMSFYPYIDNTQGLVRPVLGVGWTLNYEIFFYALLTFALLLKNKFRLAFVLAAMGLFYAYFLLHPVSRTIGAHGFSLLATGWLGYFAIGMIISHQKLQLQFKLLQLSPAMSSLTIVALVLLTTVLCSKMALEELEQSVLTAVISTICLLLCINVGRTPSQQAIASNPVLIKCLAKAGDGSYSTYLFHSFLLGISGRLISKLGISLPPNIFAILMVFSTAIMGAVLFQWIESPLQKRINGGWLRLKKSYSIKV